MEDTARSNEATRAAPTSMTLVDLLKGAFDLAGAVAGATVRLCADATANHLCASTSLSAFDVVDYSAMVELGHFDGYVIARVTHCASPIEQVGNILEHEFVVIEATLSGSVERRFFSLEKINRGSNRRSTIEMHEGPRAADVYNHAGADGPPRQAPRRRLEFVPASPVPLRRILAHAFAHMDKPFSVLSHNCQDFATELVDIIRLAGEHGARPHSMMRNETELSPRAS